MNKTLMINVCLALAILLLAGISSAQQQDEADYVVDYTFGQVQEVSPEGLIVNCYDVESDDYTDLLFSVDENTEFEDAVSLTSIKNDDYLEIVYEIRGEENIALKIIKDVNFDPEGGYEEDFVEEEYEPVGTEAELWEEEAENQQGDGYEK